MFASHVPFDNETLVSLDVKLGYVAHGVSRWTLGNHLRRYELGEVVKYEERLIVLPLGLADRPFAGKYGLLEARCRAQSRWQSAAKYATYERCQALEPAWRGSSRFKPQTLKKNSNEQKVLASGFQRLVTARTDAEMIFVGGFLIDQDGLYLILGDKWDPNSYWLMHPSEQAPALALRLASNGYPGQPLMYDIFVDEGGAKIRLREHWWIARANSGRWISDGRELYFDDQINWKSPVVPAYRFEAEALLGEMHSLRKEQTLCKSSS